MRGDVDCQVNRVGVVPGVDRRGVYGVGARDVSKTAREGSDEDDSNRVVGCCRDRSGSTAIAEL